MKHINGDIDDILMPSYLSMYSSMAQVLLQDLLNRYVYSLSKVSVWFECNFHVFSPHCSTDGSVNAMLIIKLQKGQLILSQPHCTVESFGAFTTLTVIDPGVMISFEAQSVFSSWWPDRIISLFAPSERWIS